MGDAIPKIAVQKFSSCDGCQLTMLSLEDELLQLAERVEIAYFLEARSRTLPGPYDITFVEGSVTTPGDIKRIQEVRRQSTVLVAIGACATAGGIQALRNWRDVGAFARAVYATPSYLQTLDRSTPISEHVHVDYEINGCPINKYQLLEVVIALLNGRVPHLPAHAVCLDCKLNGTPCVMVARQLPCLGPLTHAGCGAICPSFGRGCYGCYGPSEVSRPEIMISWLQKKGMKSPELVRLLREFTGYQQPFRSASEKLEKPS
jgi:sulfhydrogenase subunit delta